MKKYLPILLVFVVLIVAATIVISKKNEKEPNIARVENSANIGTFTKQRSCARPPQFLKKLKIPQPIIIDLSQKKFKGVALLYGANFQKAVHPVQWEQFSYFSTYTVDNKGNIYLVPMPHISIYPSTFNLQKNIYTLDTQTGKLSIYMHLEGVEPTAKNPYGVNAIVYDCDDNTLWIATIDKSDYKEQKGMLYHINIQNRQILESFESIDILTMSILKSSSGKFLLVGSARDNGLYAYSMIKNHFDNTPMRLLELPNANEHIRKIKIIGANTLELQSIPFSYTLIAQTAKKDRTFYHAAWDEKVNIWNLAQF